jgi:putative transcriptional regulator
LPYGIKTGIFIYSDNLHTRLADALDVSRQTFTAIETGKFDPSLPLAFRAARLFALRIQEIFHDEHRRSVATRL